MALLTYRFSLSNIMKGLLSKEKNIWPSSVEQTFLNASESWTILCRELLCMKIKISAESDIDCSAWQVNTEKVSTFSAESDINYSVRNCQCWTCHMQSQTQTFSLGIRIFQFLHDLKNLLRHLCRFTWSWYGCVIVDSLPTIYSPVVIAKVVNSSMAVVVYKPILADLLWESAIDTLQPCKQNLN